MEQTYLNLIRTYEKEGYLACKTLGEELQQVVRRYPNKAAIADKNREITYMELSEEINQYAAGMKSRGLKRGDCVIVQMPNTIELIEILFALFHLGCYSVLMLTSHREKEIVAIANLVNAVSYISTTDYLGFDYYEMIKDSIDQIPSLQSLFIEGLKESGVKADCYELRDIKEIGEAISNSRYDDIALFLLSGGTTGIPKLIPKQHEAYVYNAKAAALRCKIDNQSVYLAVLSVSHDFTLANPGVLGTLLNGGKVVLCETASFDEAFRLIQEHQVTVTSIVPAIAKVWADALQWFPGDFTSLKQILIGAAKIDEQTIKLLINKMDIKIQQGYGLGEGITCFTELDDEEAVSLRTQGKPISPADEMKIIDERGKELPAGEVGELVEKGPYTFAGYYRNDVLNARAFTPDGFFKTGDKAVIHRDGNLEIIGRVVEQINRAGENVVPAEIEEFLVHHPAIEDACVFGQSDHALGERVVACLITNGNNIDRNTICTYLMDAGVASYKFPDEIHLVDRFIYKNIGKVDKNAMRELVEKEA